MSREQLTRILRVPRVARDVTLVPSGGGRHKYEVRNTSWRETADQAPRGETRKTNMVGNAFKRGRASLMAYP